MPKREYQKDYCLVSSYVKSKTWIFVFMFLLFNFSHLFTENMPSLAGEYFYIAECYAEVKKYEKAIEFYKKAEKYEEYANAAKYNIARMYALLNEWEKAFNILKPIYEKEKENELKKMN